MVCFQEVVEIWGVYWFGRHLGRGWREDLFCKETKGRLKMGFRRPLVWLEREVVEKDRVRAYRTHPTDGFCGIAGRVRAQRHARGLMQTTGC